MKLTKAQLKQIIKEELKATMDEGLFGKAMDVMGVGGAGGRVWRAYQTMHPGDFTQMMRGKKPSAPASSSFDPSARIKDPKAVKAAITFIYRATEHSSRSVEHRRMAAEEISQYLSELDPAVVKETKEVTDAVAGASALRHEIDPEVKPMAALVRMRIIMWEKDSEKP